MASRPPRRVIDGPVGYIVLFFMLFPYAYTFLIWPILVVIGFLIKSQRLVELSFLIEIPCLFYIYRWQKYERK
jgi:hypothetical protein